MKWRRSGARSLSVDEGFAFVAIVFGFYRDDLWREKESGWRMMDEDDGKHGDILRRNT